MKRLLTLCIVAAAFAAAATEVINLKDYGVRPGGKADMAPAIAKALSAISERYGKQDIRLVFEPGVYNLYPEKAVATHYYISNHDQTPQKLVGLNIDGWNNLTVAGNGAEFMCHGRMIPVAVVNSENVSISGLSIDFADPQISQITIEESGADGIVFRPEKWVDCKVDKRGRFITRGHGWELAPRAGIAFEPDSRHIVYRTSDIYAPLDSVIARKDGSIYAPKWRNSALVAGTKVALRTWDRPSPGIFLHENKNTLLTDVTVHYAEGMGLLAQLCENISLSGFSVCLRGDDDPRYFTTQADATHFSGCKGHISSVGGLYENMMDDAINVHGTYLKVVGRPDDHTLIGRYMHPQSYGFKWGEVGDTVQFVASRTMEIAGTPNTIVSIEPADKAEINGAKEMKIVFAQPVDTAVNPRNPSGIENLTWSPSVVFDQNTIRNNRARGSLFSTPRKVVASSNLFDHTSGTAILLCGDCNGWFETGACRDVTIIDNTFVNALTNLFQFTEAIISIYPEIPDIAAQSKYFHSGIVIENNRFNTFDAPVLYAKSVDGLTFVNNTVSINKEYPPFHSNRFTYKFLRVKNVEMDNNTFDGPQSMNIDIK